MRNHRRLAGLVLAAAALLVSGEGLSAEEQATNSGVSVLVEVWRATDAALVTEIEALSEKDPGDAAAVRAKLKATWGSSVPREAGPKAERVARFLTPTTFGTRAKHEDTQQIAMTSGGGFGGFVTTGTKLSFVCTLEADGQVSTELQANITGSKKKSGAPSPGMPMFPPDQYSSVIEGSVKAPPGLMRMFQSSTRKSDTLFVFVRATQL